MISLASASDNVRLIVKIVVGIVALIVIGMLIYRLVNFIIESNREPALPAKEFGELPPIPFPESTVTSSEFTYRVNTLDGNLPILPDRLPVFRTFTPTETFLSLQESRDRVGNLGYTLGETRLDRNVYQWTKPTGEVIRYNILSHNFDILTSYLTSTPSGTFGGVSDAEISTEMLSLAQLLGADTEDLKSASEALVSYFVIQANSLVETETADSAQVARVDLFQKSIVVPTFSLGGENVTEIPIVYPIAGKSTMNFFAVPGRATGRVGEAHFVQFPITQESGEYPIKDRLVAWSELESGKAYLAKFDPNVSQIDITDVAFGYFLGNTNNGFVQPVIRFIGKDFEAYVDAVDRSTAPSVTE